MTPYSVIVFDWDGTLMDSTHSIVTAIQGACRDLELRVPTDAEAANSMAMIATIAATTAWHPACGLIMSRPFPSG
jgi:phosphoglycolate phosphatase-like HAD superfamily hydrolase